jgi:DNA-3-methyladenine glycosylase
VETEAYSGNSDKACHANDQKMTKRNRVMFESGGLAYVYLCYGIHHLFNVVTNIKGNADAVLVRAVEPVEGIETMMKRRHMDKVERRLTAGPGVLSSALGIDMNLYGSSLQSNEIWIEEGKNVGECMIQTTTRIGVEYAEEDALKPWRFYVKENKWVSKY